jgi:hypothetical protein
MKVTRYAIEDILSNGAVVERNSKPKFPYFSPMVNIAPPARRFDRERITVTVPNLHLSSTAFVVMGLELDTDEAKVEHNLELFIIDQGERRSCGTWVLTPGPTISVLPDLSEDRSIREVAGQYSFTFKSEGNFVVTLERHVSEIGSSKSTGQSPFNNRRDDALASLQIAVFAA